MIVPSFERISEELVSCDLFKCLLEGRNFSLKILFFVIFESDLSILLFQYEGPTADCNFDAETR